MESLISNNIYNLRYFLNSNVVNKNILIRVYFGFTIKNSDMA